MTQPTTNRGWTYPTEYLNPWYDELFAMFEEIDQEVQDLVDGTAGTRRKAVIDYVDCTAAPLTENDGDRYILDFTGGTVHDDWDEVDKGEIATFSSATGLWTSSGTPVEGWIAYVDAEDVDYRYVDDGTPAWEAAGGVSTLQSSYDGGYSVAVAANPPTFSVADAANSAAFRINQNDVTNNPNALEIGSAVDPQTGGASIGLVGAYRAIGSLDDGTNASSMSIIMASTNASPAAAREMRLSAFSINDNDVDIYLSALQSAAGAGRGHIYINADSGIYLGNTAATPAINIGNAAAQTIDIGSEDSSGTKTIVIGSYAANGSVLQLSAGPSQDISFIARGSQATSFTFNQTGDLTLSGFTATSIIGALNELKAGGGTPAGSGTEIQYRVDDTTLGAAGASWDTTYDTLMVGAITSQSWASSAYAIMASSDDGNFGFASTVAHDTITSYPFVNFVRARGSHASPTTPVDNTYLGKINFSGIFNNTWASQAIGAVISAETAENWSAGNYATELQFATIDTVATTDPSIRYKIDGGANHIWYGSGDSPIQRMKIDETHESVVMGKAATSEIFYEGDSDYPLGMLISGDSGSAWTVPFGIEHGSGSASIQLFSTKTTGTLSSREPVLDGDSLGYIAALGWVSSSRYFRGAQITFTCDGTPGSDYVPTKYTLSLSDTDSYTRRVRHEINAAGHHYFYGEGSSHIQLFEIDATNSYLVAPLRTSEPPVEEGAFFYDTTADVFKFGQGASPAWVVFGAGDVSKVGTPVDGQVAVFTDANTIEGDPTLTFGNSYIGLYSNTYGGLTCKSFTGSQGDAISYYAIRGRGEKATPQAVRNNDVLGFYRFGAYYDASNYSTPVMILAEAAEDHSATNQGADLVFHTIKVGGTVKNEKLRLENDGALLFQDITAPSTTTNRLYSTSVGLYYDGTRLDVSASGFVDVSGTPVTDQIAMWTDANTIEGDANLRWDGTYNALLLGGITSQTYANDAFGVEIANEGASSYFGVTCRSSVDAEHRSGLYLFRSRGDFTTPAAVEGGDYLGSVNFAGTREGTWATANTGVALYGIASENWTTGPTYTGARFEIHTVNTQENLQYKRYEIAGNSDHIWYGASSGSPQIFKLDAGDFYAVAPNRAGVPTAIEGAFFYDTTADVFKFGQGASPAWVVFGTGDVSKVGTPANDQLAVWTGDGTLEGSTDISVDSSGHMSFGATNGAAMGVQNIAEEVTISVSSGLSGVATSGNLAPADSLILAVTARVTDAPGGGATTFDVGITGSGNADELIDAVSTALNTQANSASDNDGTQLPIANGTATTLTVTTDADVTVDEMKVRLVVWYLSLTEPTS